MPERYFVRSVMFSPEGDVDISYLRPEEVRENGLILAHNLGIPGDDQYGETIEEIYAAVIALIEDALEDHGRLAPMKPAEQPDDDEDDDDE